MAALALNFWWGLLTKWLMYLWDKLTDGSLSPIDDFFGGVTRLHMFNLSLKWILEKTENWIRCSLSPIRLRRRIYTYFSSFLKTMLTDDSISPEFNKISHWFLLCTFETSWQIAASALLSGIFETFDKIMTKIDRYRSPNQESTFDLNSKLDKIIEIEYKLLSPWIFKLCY